MAGPKQPKPHPKPKKTAISSAKARARPSEPTRADRVIAFISEYCRVPEGRLVGQPIALADFQRQFIRDIYDNPHGTRRAILSVARKQGKSALIAAIVLAHLVGPERKANAQIVSGAMSRDQASLVFNLAAKMVHLEPRLQALIRVVPSTKRLLATNGSEYRALAADGARAMGISPALIILDEAGQIVGPTSLFVEALSTSQGAHEHPLMVVISTQAPSDADYLSLLIDDAQRSGDKHTVCHLYTADADCGLMDRDQWKKANPALGIFRSEKDIEEQLKQAERIPSQEASARNLLLNQRISLQTLWIAPSVWRDNSGDIDRSLFERFPVHIGLDLSFRSDLTAAVMAVTNPDTGDVHLWPHVFLPADGLEEKARRDRAPYDVWQKQGHLISVPGKTIDYGWVAEYLRIQTAEMLVASVQFDRWNITNFQAAAMQAGFDSEQWIPVGQGYKDFSPRLAAFETALLKGKIRHGGHPLLNMAIANSIATMDPAGNKKLDKSATSQRIDPIVAAVMAAMPCLDGSAAPVDINTMIF